MQKALKLYGAALDNIDVTPTAKQKNVLTIQGVVNGKLQLHVPAAGPYSISIAEIGGKVIHQISRALTVGVNPLALNLPAGVFTAQITAADGVTATQRIVMR